MHDIRTWPGLEATLTLSRPSPGSYQVEGTLCNQSGTAIRNGALVLNSQAMTIGELEDGEVKQISISFFTQPPGSSTQLINS